MVAGAFTSDPKTQHITDLVQICFYVYLRSCEYTNCTGRLSTFQFRTLLELLFFIGDHLIPVNAPINHFQHATQIVLTLYNQKNYIQGETVSHFKSDSLPSCPV